MLETVETVWLFETTKPKRIHAVGFHLCEIIEDQSNRKGVVEQDREKGQSAKGNEATSGGVAIVMNLDCDHIIG